MSGVRLNQRLMEVPLYIGGKGIEETKRELGLDRVIKLASNESPTGPSPRGVEAAADMLASAHRYPGAMDGHLRQRLAEHLGPPVEPDSIVVGNGGTDVLRMIAQAFVFDGGNTVMSRASFPMYHIFTALFGGEPRIVEPRADLGHDLAAMADAVDSDTRIAFLCTPNNPTGHIITRTEADAFLEAVGDHVVIVFDESYRAYVTGPDAADGLAYIASGRPVLTVGSFSKSAGLANMRVGYVVAPRELAAYLRHAQLPFHTSDVALAAAAASLGDEEYQRDNRRAVLEGREFLSSSFEALGLDYLPSQGNFVTILSPPLPVVELEQALLARGYITRGMAAFGLPEGLRVSVGPRGDMEAFVATLAEVLESARDRSAAL